MAVKKLSVSVPDDVEQAIKRAAADAGISVSTWVTQAAVAKAREDARQSAGRAAAKELVGEYEAEHGPLPEDSRRRARAFLAEAGLVEGDAGWQAAG